MRIFVNRKAGENSRYEQSRKPLGQKGENVKKLGGDVWVLCFILGIQLVRNSGCHQRWWLRHSWDLKAGPGAGTHFWALNWGKCSPDQLRTGSFLLWSNPSAAPACQSIPAIQMQWKMTQNGNWDRCETMHCMSVAVPGPCFGENCFKLLALAVGIICLKIACWKITLKKEKKKQHKTPKTNQQNLTVEQPEELWNLGIVF